MLKIDWVNSFGFLLPLFLIVLLHSLRTRLDFQATEGTKKVKTRSNGGLKSRGAVKTSCENFEI